MAKNNAWEPNATMAKAKPLTGAGLELAMHIASLPDWWPLTTAQVGFVLGRSVDQLEDDRRTGAGPLWFRLGNGKNGSVRYKAGKVREFIENQTDYDTTHNAQMAAMPKAPDDIAAQLMQFADLKTSGERLEDLAGMTATSVPLSSVVAVLGEQGRWAVQNARDALRRGLPDLRSRRVGGARHVPLDPILGWLNGLDGVAAGEPEPATPVSPLRAQRLGYVGRAHVELLDGALADWQRADQAREAAELRALIDAENAEPLPRRTGPRGP
ncbi:hypothetical protein [Burkholderia vietnamiensis]|uniref:hypothetical protein n=1 Tax=Burkholderia vietnamiensis TaxID=60552 RepID=UPI001594E685|nr:hypothetical protein [Burkholderia vietnamiensis]